ncbi:DUF4252 domain-containing protein [Flavivirga jejuensis]|uniref:DUF4252 domain-containing protein n=1 Tax=Flavivirga jejuensis TaxID=870487 RepID=A0ABT8WLV5_9FLAO|nr:DUF4252 domain-containing protein [Flavivirga jejuensis]MDO5974130.1 DUF4252 domain-containing protein [Flavivirga jejuensis]
MKRTIKHIFYILFIAVILVSCGNGASLQHYFVDNQESNNFISQDIPISMVKLDKSNFTEEQNEAFNSVRRLNFLGYKTTEADTETYQVELAKVKTILSDSKYNDLLEFSDKGRKVIVKYIGTDDEADEVVVFGSSKELGFGIIRVLGDDMSPDKMTILFTALQTANIDESQVKDLMNFFK